MKRRGFLTWDITWTLVLGTAMLMTMTAAVVTQRKHSGELAARREALRLCEEKIVELNGGPRATGEVRVEKLEKRAGDVEWVRVLAEVRGKKESLVAGVRAGGGR